MKRVYVAGKYSDTNVVDVLRNIGKGEEVCAQVFKLGYYPFCPWHDKTYVMAYPYFDFKVEQFQKHSMAWLEVSDCVLLVEGWEESGGTLREIERANELGIPVYKSIQELVDSE